LKELVVCSGKGGTGKTSILASFSALARDHVLADCDVDAADLHLVLTPEVQREEIFRSGREAIIRQSDCSGCGDCYELCQFEAIESRIGPDGSDTYAVDPLACEGCGVCVHFCPEKAIDFPETVCGEWYVSETRHGPMVHAKLGIGAENSGKLVTLVRNQARQLAEKRDLNWLLVDGPPGIGCPVIASLTGADMVLIVTEPTLSGLHDLERIVGLASHFEIPVCVCINKYDINSEMAEQILGYCAESDLPVVGMIPYDPEVTKAQIKRISVVEHDTSPATKAIRDVWKKVKRSLGG
jgi:MinD superfamily P-loop ATPase